MTAHHQDATTTALIEAVRSGDPTAWDEIDARYRRRLALVLRGRLPRAFRRRLDTDDLVQSALVTAREELPRFERRGSKSFRRWIRTILLNRMRSRLREQSSGKRDFRQDEVTPSALDPDRVVSRSDVPSVDRADELARLLEEVAELPEPLAELVRRRFLDEQPIARIADELGMAERTARRRIAEALARLQRQLDRPAPPSEGGGP